MTTGTTLPGLDCGLCGFRRCDDFAKRLETTPDWLERCVHLSPVGKPAELAAGTGSGRPVVASRPLPVLDPAESEPTWQDSLGRDFDFYLEHFPEEPGPREAILPHNPMITREMDIRAGDLLIGRPLGMSCGCPITHCGVAMDVDQRTGLINWCVTGPLRTREQGFKDLGYYIAEAYDGLIRKTRADVRIGMRYYFQPRMCMLQWRHSGLVNYINRTADGLQVRLEGLWIG
ncbi:MAG: Fe-S cluster protein [Phycisphaerales bacterium]|nr:Fe-S cluster protein [Phycisphaerales bacterium]